MKHFISFSILFFVSFTASAQEKKNKQEFKKENFTTSNSNLKKDYLYYILTFADTLLAHRIHLAEKSPAGVGKIDWSY